MNFDISSFIQNVSIMFVPFLMAITVHEASHGYAAYFLGDDTAKRAGRLTLNPIPHIDIVGLLFLLISQMFGWAKPVPVNFYKLRHKYGMAIVALAGPASNITLAIASAILLNLLRGTEIQSEMMYKVLLPMAHMLKYSVIINVALAVFNLLPILPLDGGRIVHNFLPPEQAINFAKSERYGFFIILILIITNVTDIVIRPIIMTVINLLI